MSPFILEEGWFLLYSVLLGIEITFVYDSLRIFRRVTAHGIIWISLEDLVYWAFVAVSIFYLLYYENDGAFRWFAIFGVLLGMFLFQKTLSPFYVKYVSLLLLRVKSIIGKLFLFLSGPLRAARRTVRRRSAAGARRIKRSMRLLKKRLTARARVAKMILKKPADEKTVKKRQKKSSTPSH